MSLFRKVARRGWRGLQAGVRLAHRGALEVRDEVLRFAAARGLRRFSAPYRLHLGCGRVSLPGWVNVDADPFESAADCLWNLAARFPVPDGSVEYVYSEHVLEHLAVEDGLKMLRECHRVLQPGSVLRVAMPSLDFLLEQSVGGDWRDQPWLGQPEYAFIQTRAEMLNVSFRWWGHRWLYDREELHRRLGEAGFETIRDVAWGQSPEPCLAGLETREDSKLICEAVR